MHTMLDSLRQLASPGIISTLARQHGESDHSIARGFSAAMPAIASTIAARADDSGFVKTFANLAMRTAASSSGGIGITSTIGSWLWTLFGGSVSNVSSSIANYAGIRPESAASLLSVAAPLVLGYFGNQLQSGRITVAGLSDLLRKERSGLALAVPAGIAVPGVAPYADAGKRASSGMSKALLALLAVAAIIAGLSWVSHKSQTQVASLNVVEPAEKAVGTTGTMAGNPVRTLPGNMTLTIPAIGSAEDRLSMYLAVAKSGATTRLTFDRIDFDPNSAALAAASNEQIDNVAKILRAYPNTAVTIVGHADGTGSEARDMQISRARATAVAERLTAAGVSPDRVHAEGYGSTAPVASNSTTDGRAESRRVDMEIVVR
jgi:outer membrane protein OmpA-like peptidoglycan-associated protein